MRRIYIVLGLIFTLLANFTVTGLLLEAKPLQAGVTKPDFVPGDQLSLKKVVNVTVRGAEQGEVLFTLSKPDFQREMAAMIELYNRLQPYGENAGELYYPQIMEFELSEGKPVLVKGEIFTNKDYFMVEQGQVKQPMVSAELNDYLRTFLMALVPDLAFKDVALINVGQKETKVFGSNEMNEFAPRLNEVVKPVIIAPRGVEASITKEGLLEEIKVNTGLKYVDALLYRPVQVKGINASRVLVIANGTYQNFVVYTDAGYNILDAQRMDDISLLEY
ncbi:MAG: hypothetical protein ACYDG6_13965 [Thermincolia bacterium]